MYYCQIQQHKNLIQLKNNNPAIVKKVEVNIKSK